MGIGKMSLAILLLWGLWPGTAGAETTPQATFTRYVQSVIHKDIKAFAGTVTLAEAFHYLDSRGRWTDSRREYLDAHRRWFEEAGWEIGYETPIIVERGDAAYAMAVFHYRETGKDGEGARLDGYFTLILFKENGEWRVVADIVTPIALKPSS